MKKLFALFLVPVFFAPLKIVSTEKTVEEAPNQVQYLVTQTVTNQLLDYTSIPEHPKTLTEVAVYSDPELSDFSGFLPSETPLEITTLILNQQMLPVFELSDGTYLPASQQFVIDDRVLAEVPFEADFWLEKGFAVYQEPYYMGAQPLPTKPQTYTKVHVTKQAQTLDGIYYYIDQQGWISENFLSATDNRIEKVQELLSSKYNKAKLSVYVEQLTTGVSAGINQDKVMYSASISKLPLLYYVQEQLNQGKISLSDKVKYVAKVHDFKGAFDPTGSGSISKTADNKDYTIEELMKKVAQESDNVATNILAYYVADQYGVDYQNVIANLADWNMEKREVSSQTAAKVMSAIYKQNGQIVDYLTHTQFDDQRIPKFINVPVAHKIGDAYDFRHDVAIVYTDEPFILSIFTENTSYDDISAIAKDIYTILK